MYIMYIYIYKTTEFRSDTRVSYKAMGSTHIQSQLCRATPI